MQQDLIKDINSTQTQKYTITLQFGILQEHCRKMLIENDISLRFIQYPSHIVINGECSISFKNLRLNIFNIRSKL